MSEFAPIRIVIGGVDRTEFFHAQSLRIHKGRNMRADADASLSLLQSGYDPPVGAQIEISTYDTDENEIVNRHFTGIIYSKEKRVHPGGLNAILAIRCLDLTAILDRRVCLENFPAQVPPRDAASIALELIGRFLDGENITVADVETGYLVATELPFKNRTVRECFDRLSTLSGKTYFIDEERGFHFSTFKPNLAPIEITEDSAIVRNLSVRESLERYRNVQRVQTDQPFEGTETISWAMRGPGENTFWYPNSVQLNNPPEVSVDGVEKTVGAISSPIGPYPGTHEFYYQPGTFGAYVQDVNAWGPPSIISITAGPVMMDSVVRTNDLEIETRKAIEGGSGRHEAVEDQRDMDSQDQLLAYADGLLRRYGRVPKEVTFETDEEGLQPGQRIPILVQALGLGFQIPLSPGAEFGEDEFGRAIFGGIDTIWIPADFLIESVTYKLTTRMTGEFFQTTVKCADSELIGTNLDIFARIAEMARLGKAKAGSTTAVTATY